MMSIKKLSTALVAMAIASTAMAQTSADNDLDIEKTFAEFRKSILQGYEEFRQNVLDEYAKYLDGIWEDYEVFKGDERKADPKPVVRPEAVKEPSDSLNESSVVVEQAFNEKNRFLTFNRFETKLKEPEPQPEPFQPIAIEIPNDNSFEFDFYGMPVTVAKVPVKMPSRLDTNHDYSTNWVTLMKTDGLADLIAMMKQRAKEMGLSDYLTYELVKSYVKASHPGVDASTRVSLTHYMLANMGYNVRLGVCGNDPAMLLSSKQNIFMHQSCVINGTKYYIFFDDDNEKVTRAKSISSCNIPTDIYMGDKIDFRINELKLPYEPYTFSLPFGDGTLTGEINKNIFPVLYRYPQMDIKDYAESIVSRSVRDDLIRQIKQHVDTLPRLQAINKILHFVQKFDYATDQERHGFEKPYFFEETLYYDKCDCEDRSIFYSYILWNALQAENMLISYPDHEAVTVRVDESIPGFYFNFDNARFYISDPTCIDAVTGYCADEYKGLAPDIDHIYK